MLNIENEYNGTKDKKEKVQNGLKAKTIIATALGLNNVLCVSHIETTKEMWDTLQVTHEGTTEVKRLRFNTLTHEYELFIVKPGENIYNMQK